MGYETQNYLKIVSSPQLRNIYAKVRTNSSRLSPNPYSEISDICDKCNTPRDFEHLLLHCEKHKTEREKFFTSLRGAGCVLDKSPDDLYEIIMNLDIPKLKGTGRNSVTPIVLSFVGVVGRLYVI